VQNNTITPNMERHLTQEQRLELVNRVCDLYASEGGTIESTCDACGLSVNTFYLWTCKYTELKDIYKKAKELSDEVFLEKLRPRAQKSLIRLIEGETYTKTKQESGVNATGSFDKTVTEEVLVLPNPTSVIFALKGVQHETFGDKRDITTNGESLNTPFANMPLSKRIAILEILESETDTAKDGD
jgi:hypothetical protein